MIQKLRFSTCLAVLALAIPGAASFDLMFMSNYATQQIHRYDPQNNLYMGAFDTVGQTTSIVVDQSRSELYGLTEGAFGYGIARYNLWTGAYLGMVALPNTWGVPASMSSGNTGEVLISAGLDVFRVNPISGSTIGSPLYYSDRSFSYTTRAGYLSEGNYLLYGNSDGTLWSNDYAMAIAPNGSWHGSYIVPGAHSSNIPRDVVTRGNESMIISQTPSTWTLNYLSRITSTSFASQTLWDSGTTRSMRYAEFGHNANGYVTYANTTNSTMGIRSFGTVLGNLGPERTLSFTNRIDGSAIFLAPEPGSLGVLAAGLVLMLRMRSAKRD